MEMQQLRHFVKAAELGSFTRAAGACGVSQPSLSQSVSRLEAEVKQPLFRRLGRSVALTPAGELLLVHAQKILALVEEAKAELADSAEAGRLTVGAIPTVAPYLLPRVLHQFTAGRPRVVVEVVEDYTAACVEKLLAGSMDLAVLALPVEDRLLQAEALFEEELFLVVPQGHALAEKPKVTAADVMAQPLILLNDNHCLSEQVVQFCRRKARQPIAVDQIAQLTTLQELVALGQGVSLVPAMARQADADPRRVYRPLSGARPTRTVGVVRHRHRFQSRWAREFIEVLRGEAARRSPPPGQSSP